MYLPKSKNEIKIIKTLIDYPKREWTIKELSKESEVSKSTVWRKIKRLKKKGFIEEDRKGKTIIAKVKNPKLLQNIVKGTQPQNLAKKETAKEFTQKIKELPKVEKCILYGSVARGTATKESDIDILVLTKEADEETEEKVMAIADKMSSKESFKIMPDLMTMQKFKILKKHDDPFAKNIEEEGETLYRGKSNE